GHAGDHQALCGVPRGCPRPAGGGVTISSGVPVPLHGAAGCHAPQRGAALRVQVHNWHRSGSWSLRAGQVCAHLPRPGGGAGADEHRPQRQRLDRLGGHQALRPDQHVARHGALPPLQPGKGRGPPSRRAGGPWAFRPLPAGREEEGGGVKQRLTRLTPSPWAAPRRWHLRRFRGGGGRPPPHPSSPPSSLLPPTAGGGAGTALAAVSPLSPRRSVAPLRAPRPSLSPGAQEELVSNTELVQSYRQQIGNVVNQANLQLFWNMYNSRRDLDINRPGTVPNAKTLRCPVMLVVGDNAPAEDGVVECNSKLDPTTTTFLKMADSGGLPQVTQPGKLTEAFKYFLQGMGYIAYLKDRRLSGGAVPSASMTRLARSRTASLTSASSVDGSRPQACTHSESSEGLGQVNHTMEVSC
uniref:NDRG family member 4 n=1 Tax=Sus scrofa TaxID=9823 RepID=A0A8D1BKE3_PIG